MQVKTFSEASIFGVLLICTVLQTLESASLFEEEEIIGREGYGVAQSAFCSCLIPVTVFYVFKNVREMRDAVKKDALEIAQITSDIGTKFSNPMVLGSGSEEEEEEETKV